MSDLATQTAPAPMRAVPNRWRRFRRHRASFVSFCFLLILVPVVFVWPLLSSGPLKKVLPTALSHAPNAPSEGQFESPNTSHLCGTDVHGRDVLSRIMHGARVSLAVGIVGSIVSLVIGVSWGATAGYLGGKIDSVMMRVVDILYSLPSVVFVIVLITTLEGLTKSWLLLHKQPGIEKHARLIFLFIGLGAVSWLTMARIIRGQVLSLRERGFVQASRAFGGSHLHILTRHILPNIYGVIITYLALTLPAVVLYESFLSFLGLGVQPPDASWGTLIAEGAGQINPIRTFWWLLLFPALFMVSTLLAFNFVGDGLKEALDVRSEVETDS